MIGGYDFVKGNGVSGMDMFVLCCFVWQVNTICVVEKLFINFF